MGLYDICFKIFNAIPGSLIQVVHLEFNCKVTVKNVNKINAGTPEANFGVFPNDSQTMDIKFNIGSELGSNETQICIHADSTISPQINIVKLIPPHGGASYTYTSDQIKNLNDNFFHS